MSGNPRIAFFGSPRLAEVCLFELLKVFPVRMVVTRPGKAAGRGRAVTPTPVARAAERVGVPLYEPPSFDAGFTDALRRHGVELNVVVAYGKLLPEEVIDFPRLGSVNLHASLLPRHRGASPIQSALLSGDTVTGITVQRMAFKMDAGDILDSLEIRIGPEWTAERLTRDMTEAAPAFLRATLERYVEGTLTPVPQKEEEATYCAPLRKEDGLIDWSGESERICRRIRAFNAWPVCHTRLDGKILRVYDARAGVPGASGVRESETPGEILAVDRTEGIIVQTGRGTARLLELQLENKRRMGHRNFANGCRGLKGKVLRSAEPPS